jgi:hypothetical protein
MLVNNVGMLDGEEPIKVSGQFLKDMFFVDPLKFELARSCSQLFLNYIICYI